MAVRCAHSCLQAAWLSTIRNLWELDPAIVVHMPERFHNMTVSNEVMRLIRSNTREVLDIPEALYFLVGDKLDVGIQRDLKVRFSGVIGRPLLKYRFAVLVAMGPDPTCVSNHLL